MMTKKSNPPLVFVDIETTGGSAYHDRVLEVAAIRVESGMVTARINQLIDPGRSIPAFITGLTGIVEADIWQAPSFSAVSDAFLKLMDEDAIFVAHNVWFDYRFLREEFRRLDTDFAPALACTVKLSRHFYPHQPSHRLDAVIERHGITVTDRHRALGDAQALVEFYELLVAEHGDAIVREALQARRPMAYQR